MKPNRIFSFFVLISAMLMSANVWAQSWDAPVKPADPVLTPFSGTWVTPTAGGTYYIYNVGAAQFMGSGRDWGTRTITTTDSIVSPEGTKFAYEADKSAAIPYSASAIGENGYLRFSPKNIDMSGFITGLADVSSWQDGDDGRAGNWQLIPGDNNEFLLHDARNEPYDPNAYVEDDPATDENETEAGLDKYRLLGVDWVEAASYTWTDAWAGTSASGKSYKVAWKFVEATDQVAQDIRSWRVTSKATYEEAVKAHEAAMAIYNARVLLYSTLNEAVGAGVDYTAAAAVYEKADATEQELLAANTQLLVNVKIATSALPVDITEVLQNPDFEVATATGQLPPGWDITITGQNLGQQNRTDTNSDTGLSITNFIEAWTSQPGTLGNGHIAQTIYGLPAGRYRLECDATSCQQSGKVEVIEGIELFIQAGVLIETTSINTGETKVTHFSVSFDNDGRNAMQFGLRANNTNANWITADNFILFYDGPLTENPNYKNLQRYMSEVNGILENAHLNADVKSQIVAALTEAEALTADATPEACDAAYEKIAEAYEAAPASIEAYEAFYDYIQDIAAYEAKVKGYGWDGLAEQLKQKKNTYYAAWEDGVYTDAEVKATIISLLPEIRQWVSEHSDALTPGTDLTILLENADFEQGQYNAGWDPADDEVQPGKDYGTTPGWTISSGNITQMNHVVEAYHRKFDFNQTIPNMPAGIYEISIQGFVRHDDVDLDKSVFYAGTFESQLMQRSEQWNATGFYTSDDQGSPCGDSFKDTSIKNAHDEDVMVPNGMSGFYFWEQEKNAEGATQDYPLWQAGDYYYTNHIKLTLAEAQDLTFGIKSLCATDWIIWDNLKIMYLGTAENGLYVENHNQSIESGKSADLKIGLDNELTNLVGFQMDLTLPEGISIDKTGCSLSSRITDAEQELTIGKLEDRTYRLTSTSLSLTPISGSLGTLMAIKLTAAEGATGGKATISNIKFSTSNSERVTLDDESFDIAVMYNVIYKVDNQEYKTASIAYGTDITPETAPEKEGYTFSGWSEIPETMPAHDVVVTGTFSINSYTLTYKVNGEVYKSATIAYGATITPEEALSKEGYTFSGWSEIPATMPARDVVVTASFTVNSYTLTYKVDGEVFKSTSIKYGSVITPESAPEKEGYTFSGWSEIPEKMPAHDIEVTGSFTIGKYTLTYQVDGKDYKSTVVTYGTPLTPEAEPTKEGYLFSGWSEIPATMPGHDVVITGRFYQYGDVNTDDEVDVVDVVDIVRFVVATPSPRFQEKFADLNSDNTVNIADAVTLVNYIAGDQNFVKAKAPRNNGQCQLQLLSSGTDALSLHLDGTADFAAFQFDVNVPDNTDISAININGMRKDGHQLLFNKVSENCYRVAALSLSNATFKGCTGELLHISINGLPTEDICVNNIHFVTTNGTDVTFDALYISGDVTGIANVNTNEDNTAIYDLQGRKLSKVQRGVNIVNGKKVVVRK